MSSTAGLANAEQLIREVYDFARAATAASGLPVAIPDLLMHFGTWSVPLNWHVVSARCQPKLR